MMKFFALLISLLISNYTFSQVYKSTDLNRLNSIHARDSVYILEYQTAKKFHELLNQYRNKKGLTELSWSDDLWLTGRNHNLWMMVNQKLSHQENNISKNFTGKGPGDRLKYVAKDKCTWTGENCLYNYAYDEKLSVQDNAIQIAKESLEQWKTSSGHNKNMLGEHESQATSFIIDKRGVVWATTLFGICK